MSTLATATPAAIDLRTIVPRERHAQVFGRFDALQAGQATSATPAETAWSTAG